MALLTANYDRRAAINYANRWAYFRNADFYDFSEVGGDCTSFVSQCLLAGGAVMNYTPVFGWYYRSSNDRTASWSGVQYFFDFITQNKGIGPFGSETTLIQLRPGDVIQMILGDETEFHHTVIVTAIRGFIPSADNITVAAHSYDCACRPLSSYDIRSARFIHIDGIRFNSDRV